MKSIFENVIHRGGYDLTGLLKQVDKYHIEGKLSDADREALYAMARRSPQAQIDCAAEIHKLWAAVRELQAAAEGGASVPSDAWPEFTQPTGAHDAYHAGDQVTYNESKYRCIMDNCVWSPDVLPDAWEVIEDA